MEAAHTSASRTVGVRAATLIALGFLLLLPTQGRAQEDPLSGLDEFISRVMETWRAPGIALAVVRNDSVLLAKGFGVKDVRTGAPMDERSLMAVASTSKAFTAATSTASKST
jgi:CubicO group peptidase (beta-lactamase class C family)